MNYALGGESQGDPKKYHVIPENRYQESRGRCFRFSVQDCGNDGWCYSWSMGQASDKRFSINVKINLLIRICLFVIIRTRVC